MLATLASRPGELITHDELRRAVWGETTHVKMQDALHYCIRQIRTALEDSAREPRYIENLPRRGYRLRADCIVADSASSRLAPPNGQRWALRLAVAAMLAITIVTLDRRPNNHHEVAVKAVKTLHNLLF